MAFVDSNSLCNCNTSDKGYDTQDFVAELRELHVTPHVAQNTNRRRSAIDGRTTRHPGYALSLRIRKRRGSVRLGQDRGRDVQGAPPRAAEG